MSEDKKDETIAELLHQLAEKSGGINLQDILKEAKKVALKGRNFLTIKCSEADYEAIAFPLTCEETELVRKLKANGFVLKSDFDISFWSYKRCYNLTLHW